MKTLYLVRHAKSSWKQEDLSDFQRPLNDRGRSDAPQMGRFLKENGVLPQIIISSPAVRALTTARVMAGEMGFETSAIVQDKNIYEAGVSTLLEIIRDIDDEKNSAMVFGHNPSFTWLASELGGKLIDNMPTCGVATIHLDLEHWKDTGAGMGRLHAFDFPKKHFIDR